MFHCPYWECNTKWQRIFPIKKSLLFPTIYTNAQVIEGIKVIIAFVEYSSQLWRLSVIPKHNKNLKNTAFNLFMLAKWPYAFAEKTIWLILRYVVFLIQESVGICRFWYITFGNYFLYFYRIQKFTPINARTFSLMNYVIGRTLILTIIWFINYLFFCYI